MSEAAMQNVLQASQIRTSQRTEQTEQKNVQKNVPFTRLEHALTVQNVPASLESSIADLADIMYALGAAKSSIKKEKPVRRPRTFLESAYSPSEGSDTYRSYSNDASLSSDV